MDKIIQAPIEEEMKNSYIDYAMSVIMGRALPDVRDGLKPVQRRILYTMLELGLLPNKPFKKSATIIGSTMAKYHPHGDSAIYDALARMAQEFSLRYPLIQGQGNFGSIDGDRPAAMRYTEARLSKYGLLMLEDIDKETIPFMQNFDATLKEPIVLPSRIPNLLINGSTGIAVGMSTNIPPHNITEVINALTALIDNPNLEVKELMQYIKGPDFPNGGIIIESHRLIDIYEKGYGSIKTRARIEKEDHKIIVKDLPAYTNKSTLVREIAEAAKNNKVLGIKDIRDESNREGIRIVIELNNNADIELVEKQLYAFTGLENSIAIKLLALKGKKPVVMNLKQLLQSFIDHRKTVIINRSKYLLRKARDRLHIVEGLIIAISNIDRVITIVKKSRNINEAVTGLMNALSITEKQARAIVDMKISRLTAMETNNLLQEKDKLEKEISRLEEILSSNENILRVVKQELIEVKEKLGDERRTMISDDNSGYIEEDIIRDNNIVVILTMNDYLKAVSLEEFREQRRGGKGILIAREETPKKTIITHNKEWLLLFSNKGKIYWLKAYQVPLTSRYSKGRHISNLLSIEKDEKIVAMINTSSFEGSIVFLTRKGIGKRVYLSEFSNPRRTGIRAISIDEGDELMDVALIKDKELIMIATRKGRAVLFKKQELRPMGRTAKGVILVRLRNDEAISIISVDSNDYVLTITTKGYGRMSRVSDYRLTSRGSLGVLNLKEGVGEVVNMKTVNRDSDVLVLTTKRAIRFTANELRPMGRTAKGVRVIKIDEDEKVINFDVFSEN